MSRTATRLGAAVTAIGLVALALPANAAEPTYSPGDTVTVDGASVIAPAPGNATAISVDRVGAPSTTLVVTTAADGTVTVSDGMPVSAPETPTAPNKCDDNAYTLINGSSWPGKYKWRFNKSSTPNELGETAAEDAMKESVKNITGADNNCGEADQVGATQRYKGSTSSSSDVNGGSLTCDATANGLNVTEFGDITGTGVLAATCTYTTGTNGDITAASVLVNTDFEWWISGSCTSAHGLKAVQTHEYGHAFGVSHVDELNHGNLTMSTNINDDCSNFEANLGLGDILALEDLY